MENNSNNATKSVLIVGAIIILGIFLGKFAFNMKTNEQKLLGTWKLVEESYENFSDKSVEDYLITFKENNKCTIYDGAKFDASYYEDLLTEEEMEQMKENYNDSGEYECYITDESITFTPINDDKNSMIYSYKITKDQLVLTDDINYKYHYERSDK